MIGRLLYFLLYPVLWLYAPFRRRAHVVIYVNNQVLIVKEWIGIGVWGLPGGSVKRGEDPVTAGLREVQEELGLAFLPAQATLLNKELIVEQHHGLIVRGHYVLIRLRERPNSKTNYEIAATKWVALADAPIAPTISKTISSVV